MELTGPEWAGRHEWPVYAHGAPLANYLLETFGPEKYLEFYSTCRRAHFADDCRRILGIDLEQLDRDYWNSIEKLVANGKPFVQRRLESLRRSPEIGFDEWRQFLDEYFAAVPRLLAPFDSVRIAVESTVAVAPGRTDSQDSTAQLEFVRQGKYRIARLNDGLSQSVVIAGPSESQRYRRPRSESKWLPDHNAPADDREALPWARAVCDEMLGLKERETILAAPHIRGQDPAAATLVGFERFENEGKRFARVRLKWESRRPDQCPVEPVMTFTFDADDGYRLKAFHYDFSHYAVEGEQEYVERDGTLVAIHRQTRESDSNGLRYTADLHINVERLDLLPREEFTAAVQLDGPIDATAARPDSSPRLI